MMTAQPELLRANILLPPPTFSGNRKFPARPTSSICSCAHKAWIAQLSEDLAIAAVVPPAEVLGLPASVSSFLAASDDPTFQTSAAILLTGAFTLFLFRSLRRRARLAKQMRLRSTGAVKNEEAFESLRKASNLRIKVRKSKTSADEALVGALIAAAFGLLLYKFTTTVEYTLNHQVLSNNYSVRQITISIRTIINGICYLATFVFGFNSIGLFLYSGQLALNSSYVTSDDEANSKSPDREATDHQTSEEDTTPKI